MSHLVLSPSRRCGADRSSRRWMRTTVARAPWRFSADVAQPCYIAATKESAVSTTTIRIEDDGIGRDAARQLKKMQTSHKSYGIEITQQRILMLDPSNAVVVEDLKNENGQAAGTAVCITLKI